MKLTELANKLIVTYYEGPSDENPMFEGIDYLSITDEEGHRIRLSWFLERLEEELHKTKGE